MIEAVLSDFGKIDILVNNVGMSMEGAPEQASEFAEISDEEWDQTIARNLTTCYNVTRLVLLGRIQRRYGRIVNVSSVTGPVVEVTVRVDAGGGEPRLWVIDQGPGVPAAFVEQLFEPFAQASSLQTRKRGGTGLGLAISRAMMEQMGGRIGLEPPEPGRGAVFWIALPPAPVLEQALG